MNISDKVVCIDDDWSKCWTDPHPWFSELPKAGLVYVVCGVGFAKNGERQIQLVGIKALNHNGRLGFYPHRFRLLKTAVAVAEVERKAVAS